MPSRYIDDWIARFLAERPVRANSLIITVYGDMISAHGGTVWLGSFIRLVQPLGLNERMVRTSVFRLVKEKWLVAEQIGRRSYYSLTASGRRRFEHANRRIYDAPAADWNGEWHLVLTGGALEPATRDALRKELLWEGFGNIAPGVLAHPSANVDSLLDILEDSNVRDKLVVMQARALGGGRRPGGGGGRGAAGRHGRACAGGHPACEFFFLRQEKEERARFDGGEHTGTVSERGPSGSQWCATAGQCACVRVCARVY